MNIKHITKSWFTAAAAAALASMTLSIIPITAVSAGPPPVVISTTPLTVVIPSHPQVIIAVANSNSMDSSDDVTDDANADLTSNAPSSAIMTWSGNIGPAAANYLYGPSYASLESSTSPVNYQVPAGFTAPITGATSGSTPYTAPIATYTPPITPGFWGCAHWDTDMISVPAPHNPPTTDADWPGFLIWDQTQTWYYNGINNPPAGPNGYYEQPFAPPSAAIHKIPSAREKFHGEGESIAMYGTGGLLSVGMGGGGKFTSPRATSTISPPPPLCGPAPLPPCVIPPPTVCDLWQWVPPPLSMPANTYYADNSPSRLNITKASITQIISSYASDADFGLMKYRVTGVGGNYTWAYYTSLPGGFTFSNVYTPPTYAFPPTPAIPYPPILSQTVNNPCYSPLAGTVNADCNSLASQTGLTPAQLKSFKFMAVAGRSDDPLINDIFLVNNGSFNGVPAFLAYNGPTPATPYPPNYSIAAYNSGGVTLTYANTTPQIGFYGSINTSPTNAGFVAYSPQVFYAQRGWLWAGSTSTPASYAAGDLLVPVTAMGAMTLPSYMALFSPHLLPENNVPSSDAVDYATWGNTMYASAGQSPTAGLLNQALTTYTSMGDPPGPSGCIPPQYVILMTDGLPTQDLSGNSWPPPGSAAATGYGSTVAFNADGSLNVVGTSNQAVIDTITKLQALQAIGVKTFVVGLGAGANPALNLNPDAIKTLTAMAIAGGTASGTYGYYPGPNAGAVTSALTTILNLITSVNVSSVSGAVNTSGLNASTVVYQASYTGFDTPYQDWTGDLKAFAVNANTATPTTYGQVNTSTAPMWSAQCQLDILATGAVCPGVPGPGAGWNTARLVATWNPSSNTGVPFRWADISAAQQAELQPADALGSDRLNYLRGDTLEETRNGGADNFRNRSHILGDIVDSGTLYVGAPAGPYTADVTYQNFESTNSSRTAMVYAGANDGMLHAFNASTGNESYAFIPNGVFANLINLTQPGYNSSHRFFVDGSPTAGDVKFSGACGGTGACWHTVLVGGLNDGGNSIYALDVTNPGSIGSESALASSVLWEFTDPHLGLTYSQPVIALTNDTGSVNANPNGFLVFFGSGYNNDDGNDYLYAVNPQTGQLVQRVNLCAAVPLACSGALPNGLSGVTVINSTGAVGQPADTVYAGDLQGNLWKVNISNANPASWVVSLLFQAQDSLSNPQPITVTPIVSLAPNASLGGTVVYFGTGEYLGIPDITLPNSAKVQSFYGIWDNGTSTTRAALVQQTLSDTTVVVGGQNIPIRTVSTNAVNFSSLQRGWYIDLGSAVSGTDTGERVITNPRLYNGEVIFTTYVPTTAALCTGGGQSFLMAVNYANGSSFPQPEMSYTGDNALTSLAGQNPVGIGLGAVFASAPTILSANNGSIQTMKLTTISGPAYSGASPYSGLGNIANIGERGGMPSRLSWFQIR